MPTLETRDLVHRYPSGVLALDGVTLRIGSEAVAIVGENGAGKTTLVKHFNGLLQPTGGDVLVDEASVRGKSVATLARSVGLVFQNPNDQIFNASVWSEAAFGPRNLGHPPDRVEELVSEALSLVGLSEKADEHPYGLTLSERKLLCIASVVAMDTPIVILDEPTTGQDLRGVRQVAAMVGYLRERGRAVIAVTHDMSLVAEAFERTVVMGRGRVMLDGPTRDVFGEPAVLRECGVEPPPVTRLAQRLHLPETPLSVDELCAAYRRSGDSARFRSVPAPATGG